jgi:hypothetical protein
VAGQLSVTNRSLDDGAYAPIDDAYTSVDTPAAITARTTWALPCTFGRRSSARS